MKNIDYFNPKLTKAQNEKINKIFTQTCELYDENPAHVYSKSKTREEPYVTIRQITCTLVAEKTFYSHKVIAGFFRKERSLITHCIKTIKGRREVDIPFRKFTNKLFL